jgi:hypothetical protein
MTAGLLFRLLGGVKRDSDIDAWLAEQQPDLRAIAQKWFDRMRACGDDVVELMHDGCPTACVEDAAFAYVGVYRAHVNVAFFRGAALDDPAGLLEGSGKRMRHVKCRPGALLDAANLQALIDAAYADIKTGLATERSLEMADP